MRFSSSKCTKMRLQPGLFPLPHLGSLQRSPDSIAELQGRGGQQRERKGRGRKGEQGGREGGREEREGGTNPLQKSGYSCACVVAGCQLILRQK